MAVTRGRLVAALALAAALVAGAIAWWLVGQHRNSADQRLATSLVRRYVAAWARQDYAMMTRLATGAGGLAATYQQLDSALQVASVRLVGARASGNDPVRVTAQLELLLGGLGDWHYRDQLLVTVRGRRARIDWSPAAVYPGLRAGDRLVAVRARPQRAPIVAVSGQPLSADTQLADAIGGATGRASPRQAAADPSRLRPGDPIGLTNLESRYDSLLAGRASGRVLLESGSGTVLAVLHRFAGRPPQPLHTLLNLTLQRLAERSIAGTGRPTAIAVLNVHTGALLAEAANPPGYPLALLGRYPPGSTFKMVTLTAALRSGMRLSSPVPCHPSVTVNGQVFHNANGESVAAPITLLHAFAISCNTAFITVALRLPAGALLSAAKLYGCTAGHAPLPVVSYGCWYPPSEPAPNDYAASAFGQDGVLSSPLMLAAIAAGIGGGAWQEPRLLAPGTPGAPAPVVHRLPASLTSALHTAMRAVVTGGTGVTANLPGLPVYGKTGTAEFGNAHPPQTDAWFAAFRGNLALAVVVQGGGFGETAAAPVVARFLAQVPPSMQAGTGPG